MEPATILNLIISASQDGPYLGPTLGPALQVWSESAASILISSLWQGAVVACGLALCLRLAPRIPARLRYAVWAAGFAALVSLPFLPALVKRLTPSAFNPATADSFAYSSGPSAHPLLALDARWSLAIAALWLAASLVRVAVLAVHAVYMRRLWISASPVGAAHGGVLEQSGDTRRVAPAELCVTSELDRPCVIGFFRPRILIPTWLLNRLSPAELEQVVLHESEHLRRMDDWTNLLQKLCLAVFPLNPALWWLERRLCAEREMACDDAVVGRTKAPRAYAACLAGLAEKGIEHRTALRLRGALSLGAWQRRPELATRVHRLLRRPPVLSPAASAASLALVGCGLVAGTIALARSPQLVAFVAPADQASNILSASARMPGAQFMEADVSTDFNHGSGTFASSTSQPYRAVKTLAIMPGARIAPLPRGIYAAQRSVSPATADETRQGGDSSQTGHSLASLVPNAVAARIKAQQPHGPESQQASQSAEAPATQTSWIVLTSFEEVQTTRSDGDVQGDSVVGETGASSADTGRNTSTSISVTRLVLRFVQPASNTQPVPNAGPASNSSQPIAIPYRDGWFVIQL